ncbi:uncharacterized protein si:dkey-111e8.4 [Ictalurus furcatus]|uniref:uncharacterized protein si:dkey-111e8.4 n=1 Tax=Ictalurus furcatus TaxID=66913 RepID=UPI002350B8D8|nr:uncharacterized protein si:dkey-111e8.4 [Ictalurus furcatus]
MLGENGPDRTGRLSRVSSMSEWLKSDIFIVFMVVLSLTVISIFAVCCLMRRRRTYKTRQKMAEIEIVPFAGSGRNHKPRFTLRIITEQKHASELVQMLTSQIRSTAGPAGSTGLGVSAVTAEVASTSQDQLEIWCWFQLFSSLRFSFRNSRCIVTDLGVLVSLPHLKHLKPTTTKERRNKEKHVIYRHLFCIFDVKVC